MLDTKFTSWPHFSQEEADRVSQVLLSNKVNYWTGEEGRAFEAEFARAVGSEHAVALANGSLALDAIMRVIGIGPGDEVVVTPRTFIASASCVVLAQATPVFADVDPDTQNITAETIEAVLTRRTKAIICVHLGGMPCDMDPIMDLAAKHHLIVIEDCAQAHGATYHGRAVGSLGHVAAWSFCQDKIMTTGGEGGMVTTNDRDLWSAIWSFKDHGKSWEAVYEKSHPPGFRWLHESFGSNYRMLEMQSAIGRIQLRRLPDHIKRRNEIAGYLSDTCRQFLVLRVPRTPNHITNAFYRFYAFVRPDRLAPEWSRDRIAEAIVEHGVPCYHGSCSEIYKEKAFERQGIGPRTPLPVAVSLGETSPMFLVHPTLTDSEVGQTCDVLRKVLKEAVQ